MISAIQTCNPNDVESIVLLLSLVGVCGFVESVKAILARVRQDKNYPIRKGGKIEGWVLEFLRTTLPFFYSNLIPATLSLSISYDDLSFILFSVLSSIAHSP